MAKRDDYIQLKAKVREALPNATFKVVLNDGHEILAHLAGKLRMHFIKIMPGDEVIVEVSAYDLSRGRIIYRLS